MFCCFGSENEVCTFCNYKETIGARVVSQVITELYIANIKNIKTNKVFVDGDMCRIS